MKIMDVEFPDRRSGGCLSPSHCRHSELRLPEFSVTESALRRELLTEPLKVVNGRVAVPTKPGLGIEINPETVQKYSIRTGI